jgi:hypothetical protein
MITNILLKLVLSVIVVMYVILLVCIYFPVLLIYWACTKVVKMFAREDE